MPLGTCQANYYITPEFNDGEKMKSGVSRIGYLKKDKLILTVKKKRSQ